MVPVGISNTYPSLYPAVSTTSSKPCSLNSASPFLIAPSPLSTIEAALTDHFNFVSRIDLPNFVKHSAGVFPTILWLQILQVQCPLLLLVLPSLMGHEGLIVLQPRDVRPWVAAGHTLQTDGAANRTGDDSASHLCRLGEPGLGCKRHEQLTLAKGI